MTKFNIDVKFNRRPQVTLNRTWDALKEAGATDEQLDQFAEELRVSNHTATVCGRWVNLY